jgi:hypothetical protein
MKINWRLNYFISISLVFITFSSCKISSEEDINFKKFLRKYPQIEISNYKNVLFIPIDGCGKCTDAAIDFLISEHKEYMIYVLSSADEKLIKSTIPEEVLRNENVILDTSKISYIYELVGTSPVLFHLKNGRIIEIINLGDSNSKFIFDQLE